MRFLNFTNCLFGTVLLAASLAGRYTPESAMAKEENAAEVMIAHDVYFALNDASPESRQKLVHACKKYLTGHPGEVFFAVGTVSVFDRPVNDRDWDVGLHVVFKSKADHDLYQEAPRHKQFIEQNKDNWKKVRVFDTDATK